MEQAAVHSAREQNLECMAPEVCACARCPAEHGSRPIRRLSTELDVGTQNRADPATNAVLNLRTMGLTVSPSPIFGQELFRPAKNHRDKNVFIC